MNSAKRSVGLTALRPSPQPEDIIWADLFLVSIFDLFLIGRLSPAASFCTGTEYRHGPEMSQGTEISSACPGDLVPAPLKAVKWRAGSRVDISEEVNIWPQGSSHSVCTAKK